MQFPPAPWRLAVQSTAAATIVRLAGTCVQLHEEDVERLRDGLFRLAEEAGGRHLMLDLGDVHFLTSSSIGVLLFLRRQLRERGGRLSLCNLTPAVAEVFDTLRLGGVLDVRPGPADALHRGGEAPSRPTAPVISCFP